MRFTFLFLFLFSQRLCLGADWDCLHSLLNDKAPDAIADMTIKEQKKAAFDLLNNVSLLGLTRAEISTITGVHMPTLGPLPAKYQTGFSSGTLQKIIANREALLAAATEKQHWKGSAPFQVQPGRKNFQGDRLKAVDLINRAKAAGVPDVDISRITGVSGSTIRYWVGSDPSRSKMREKAVDDVLKSEAALEAAIKKR